MRVLFVDDDVKTQRTWRRAARSRFGATVFTEASAPAGIATFESERPDTLVLDVRLRPEVPDDRGGLGILMHARRSHFTGPALIVSGMISPELRDASLAAGATDCICKTEFNMDVLARHALRGVEERMPGCELLGRSAAMVNLRQDIWDVARMESPPSVLITGPTGSGKELIAKTLHAWSRRKNEPFFAINSAAMTHLESELFGHERGAFTGAITRRAGAFEEASRGTIFLDEIGDLPLEQQAKLLRVLETKDFRPMGSNRAKTTNAWVIAATHVDLQARIREGRFREDLYRRLGRITLAAPSLTQRPEDVRHLAKTFGDRASPPIAFTHEALEWLVSRAWPGNVRQLQSVIENVLAFVRTRQINIEDLERIMIRPGLAHSDAPVSMIEKVAIDLLAIGGDFGSNLDAAEQAALEFTLRASGHNKSAAARALGMDRSALLRKLAGK